jgi:solute carrier family 4 anion exchanger 2
MIFHAFASQPLVFVGTTGPLILFDEALIKFCQSMGYSFLSVRVYVGFWLSAIALTMAAFEGSVFVRFFTRFTQEIFSALITLIYIVETALKLVVTFQRHPLHAEYVYKDMDNGTSTIAPSPLDNELDANVTETSALTSITDGLNLLIPWDKFGPLNQPNTALFCTLLTLGTFTSAYSLRIFRNSKFLGRNARRALGDFGVPISIAIFVGLAYSVSNLL